MNIYLLKLIDNNKNNKFFINLFFLKIINKQIRNNKTSKINVLCFRNQMKQSYIFLVSLK